MAAGHDTRPAQLAVAPHDCTVKKYKLHFEEQNPDASFNPFTVIRHCLYLGDKKLFRTELRNVARQAFEAWLAENHV